MTRDGDGESARVFGMSLILEPILVVVFCSSVHTVLRNVLKRGCQKVAKVAPKVGPGRPGRPGLFLLEVFRERPPIKTARAARAGRARHI